MRVGILAFLQETNTFSTGVTRIDDFAADLLLTGEEVRRRFAGAEHEVGGFFAGLAAAGIEAVPIFAARAVPGGPIVAQDFDELLARLLRELASAGRLDGVLAAAHGATVSEFVDDVDGYWLTAVRNKIGESIPLIGTLDPHANLSPHMVDSCNALIAYRTNPHLDQRARGLEAAELMARTLRGEVAPVQAAAFPPMILNIESQDSSQSPCREALARTDEVRLRPGIVAASLLLGFPYADVEEMGAATLVVADGDQRLAQREADCLAEELWRQRQSFQRLPVGVAQAVERVRHSAGPVCLLDVGDNVGGGGPGDTTHLAHALRDAGIFPALVCLADPAAVVQAEQAGVGGNFVGEIGGKSGGECGASLAGRFHVIRLCAGRFSDPRPRHGGFAEFNQGPSAVLVLEPGLTILATSRRTPPFSLRQLTSCGLDPREFRAVVAKGVHAPVAAYREVCAEFIRVDTPGLTTANVARLDYRRRRRPLFPWEPDCPWTPQ